MNISRDKIKAAYNALSEENRSAINYLVNDLRAAMRERGEHFGRGGALELLAKIGMRLAGEQRESR